MSQRILRLDRVEDKTGLAKSTIYLRMKEGKFPRPVPPSESYEVDDLLRELTNAPAPAHLSSFAMRNSKESGWRPDARKLAKV